MQHVNKVLPEAFYQDLDPGIRFAVRVLHANGFETCQSCQGGKDHSYIEPTVDMVAGGFGDAAGMEVLGPLTSYGLQVSNIALVWSIDQGLPYEKLWRITFCASMESRADEKPNPVWSYQLQE
jgi:hypothetical protein